MARSACTRASKQRLFEVQGELTVSVAWAASAAASSTLRLSSPPKTHPLHIVCSREHVKRPRASEAFSSASRQGEPQSSTECDEFAHRLLRLALVEKQSASPKLREENGTSLSTRPAWPAASGPVDHFQTGQRRGLQLQNTNLSWLLIPPSRDELVDFAGDWSHLGVRGPLPTKLATQMPSSKSATQPTLAPFALAFLRQAMIMKAGSSEVPFPGLFPGPDSTGSCSCS